MGTVAQLALLENLLGGRAFEPRLCCEYATTCGQEACDELRFSVWVLRRRL
jgi:hypothetical protein